MEKKRKKVYSLSIKSHTFSRSSGNIRTLKTLEDELYSGCSQEQFSDGSTYQQIKLNGSKEALIQAQFPEFSHSCEQECGQGEGIVMYRRRWFRNK